MLQSFCATCLNVKDYYQRTAESSKKGDTKIAPSAAASVDIMKELTTKQTNDVSLAATGLKKVSRARQTWHKEYKATITTPATTITSSTSAVKPSQIKASQKPTSTISTTAVIKAPVYKFQRPWIEMDCGTSN